MRKTSARPSAPKGSAVQAEGRCVCGAVRFEIDVPAFGQPLRNRMELEPDEGLVTVTPL